MKFVACVLAVSSMLLLPVAVGCTRTPVPSTAHAKGQTKGYVPIFHVATDDQGLKDELAAKFKAANIDAKLLSVRELPPSQVPDWAKDSEEGWLAFVKPAQRAEAEAVQEAWFKSLSARAEAASRPQPPAPLVLGEAKPVPAETLASLKAELAKRVLVDQAVRKDPKRHDEMKQVDADNTAWLRKVAVEHGWIDTERFGTKAANAAFLLVQHSGDLPLMTAALPQIEQEVKAGRLNGQNFALLFDRLQLMQGGQQRYGSQVMKDSKKGDWVVRRLEDPDRVDELRKEMGLEPLEKYLARFGDKVRIER